MELSGYGAQAPMIAGENIVGRKWAVVHVPPLDFVTVLRQEALVKVFVVAWWCVPGVGEQVEVTA